MRRMFNLLFALLCGVLITTTAAAQTHGGYSPWTCPLGSTSLCTTSMSGVTYDIPAASGYFRVQLGTDTSATDFQVLNNSGTVIWGVDGAGDVAMTGGLSLVDGENLTVGTGADLVCSHDGVDTLCTSATGNFTIDNTNATGATVLRLGTDTGATTFEFRNDSDTAALILDGAGLFDFDGGSFDLDPQGAFTLDMDATMTAIVTTADNLVDAFEIQEGASTYLSVDTSDGDETIYLGNTTTDQAVVFDTDGPVDHVGYHVISVQGSVQTTGADTTCLTWEMETTDSVALVDAMVVAVESDGTDRAGYHLSGLFYRDDGNATQEGTDVSINTQESDTDWAVDLDVDGANAIEIETVDATASETINWSCSARITTWNTGL